jgi:hypothetical protein
MTYQLVTNFGLRFKKNRIYIKLMDSVDPIHAIKVYGRSKCIASRILDLGTGGR